MNALPRGFARKTDINKLHGGDFTKKQRWNSVGEHLRGTKKKPQKRLPEVILL